MWSSSGHIWDIWESGQYIGEEGEPQARVSVEPDWYLQMSGAVIGAYTKGPVRSYQTAANSQVEIEIPNVSVLEVDESIDADAATCRIEIDNQVHIANASILEPSVLGDPGYFAWGHGDTAEAQARWGQTPNAWANVLVPNALLRSWEGYGGRNKTIPQAVADGNIRLTGVWLIDEVRVGVGGKISISCRSMAKLLLEQIVFPPLVPESQYPMARCRWRFEDVIIPGTPTSITANDQVSQYGVCQGFGSENSGSDVWYPGPNAAVHGHRPSDAFDGDAETYWYSVGNGSPDLPFALEWIEICCGGQDVNDVYLHPWAGNYTCYVSVWENGAWVDGSAGEVISYDPADIGLYYGANTANIPWVAQTGVPWEEPIDILLPRVYKADKIRLSFTNLQYSPDGPFHYRAGVRECRARIANNLPGRPDEHGTKKGNGNYCVDYETEILTDRGWLKHYEVAVGDNALGINPSSGLSEWQTISNVYQEHRTSLPMIDLAGRDHNSLTTPDHRWLINHPLHAGYSWAYSDELGPMHSIPTAASHSGFPSLPKYSDEFVELVAWFWTEGCLVDRASLSQSEVKNPEGVIRIDRCLRQQFGEPGLIQSHGSDPKLVEQALQMWENGASTAEIALAVGRTTVTINLWVRHGLVPANGRQWSRSVRDNGVVIFRLSHRIRPLLLSVMDEEKVVSPEFICSLTEPQLRMFIDISVEADGNTRWDQQRFVSQKSERRIKSFEMACALAGISTSTNWAKSHGQFVCTLRKRYKTVPCTPTAMRKYTSYTGVIWCPTTLHHNWLARRRGRLFYTGNTDYSEIVRDLALWAGFNLRGAFDSAGQPQVYGNIENTGIYSDDCINEEVFDKKPVIDVMKTFQNIVGFICWVDSEGAFRFESPNFWGPGNFLADGSHTALIPEIDETRQLTDYGVSYKDRGVVSEIIISSERPEVGKFNSTVTTRFTPPSAALLRGIVKPFGWVNGLFQNPDEQRILAELVAMHIFFQLRQGSVTAAANPNISINDQVRIWERETSESFIHYIRGVTRRFDKASGSYSMTLTTHWLGGSDGAWVVQPQSTSANGFTRGPSGTPVFEYSERLGAFLKISEARSIVTARLARAVSSTIVSRT